MSQVALSIRLRKSFGIPRLEDSIDSFQALAQKIELRLQIFDPLRHLQDHRNAREIHAQVAPQPLDALQTLHGRFLEEAGRSPFADRVQSIQSAKSFYRVRVQTGGAGKVLDRQQAVFHTPENHRVTVCSHRVTSLQSPRIY